MDFFSVIRSAGLFFVRLCEVRFTFGGISFSAGAFFLFAALVPIVMGFIHSLSD